MNNHWLIAHGWLIAKWAISFAFISIALVQLCKALRFNPSVWDIPRYIIQLIIQIKRGRRYIAKIDETWRMIKGGHVSAAGFLHTPKLLPEYKVYCLSNYEFHPVELSTSDSEVQLRIITLNIRELSIKHPRKNTSPCIPRDPFGIPYDALHDWDNDDE